MWSRLLALALLLLPAPALAGVKEKVAALAPSGLVLVLDAEGNELVAQNADGPWKQLTEAWQRGARGSAFLLEPDQRRSHSRRGNRGARR